MIEQKLEPRQCLPCEIDPIVETDYITGATSIKCEECYREISARNLELALTIWDEIMVAIKENVDGDE